MKDDLISVNKMYEIIEEVRNEFFKTNDELNEDYRHGVNAFYSMLHSLMALESSSRVPLKQQTRRCLTCGEEFTISSGELDWLFERELKPYKRCKACRQKRKIKKEINANVN